MCSRRSFRSIRSEGLAGLRKVLHLDHRPRSIEGIDIAHIAGTDTVASVVQFIDGLPFRPGYRRMRIQGVSGPDDTASIHEAVTRRFRRIHDEDQSPPDILLIDGGRGQLNAALSALGATAGLSSSDTFSSTKVISLAKREELVFTSAAAEPLRAKQTQLRVTSAAIRPRRSSSFRTTLSSSVA